MTTGECNYRYTLTRSWQGSSDYYDGQVCFIMLNPSTADEHVDDPTIRRVIRFSEDHGFGRLVVVNLFAVRATDPKLLAPMHEAAIGPHNDDAIAVAVAGSKAVVAAWGANNFYLTPLRKQKVTTIVERLGQQLLCLGKTKDGHPRHPLYVPAATRLEPY